MSYDTRHKGTPRRDRPDYRTANEQAKKGGRIHRPVRSRGKHFKEKKENTGTENSTDRERDNCCPGADKKAPRVSMEFLESTLQDLLRAFGLPVNVMLPEECEDEIWDAVVGYRKIYRWWQDKRLNVKESLARKQIEKGQYYTPEAWDQVRLSLPQGADIYTTKVEGEDMIVPIWPQMKTKFIKELAAKRNKARQQTIAKVRKVFADCIDQAFLPPPGEQIGPQPHPKILLKLSVREILTWFGLPPSVRLDPGDEEAIVDIIEEFRFEYQRLELERAEIVEETIKRKSEAGEYYNGKTLLEVFLDPRVVERREEIRPMRVDGKQVYVTVGLRDDRRLRQLAHEEADLLVDAARALHCITAKYEKTGATTSGPAREDD